jgi:hypothetical protein
MKIGVCAVFIGVVGIMWLKVLSVDLTEGQALARYWPGWLAFAAMLVGGAWIVKRNER